MTDLLVGMSNWDMLATVAVAVFVLTAMLLLGDVVRARGRK